jgi:hypothetical protein
MVCFEFFGVLVVNVPETEQLLRVAAVDNAVERGARAGAAGHRCDEGFEELVVGDAA